MICINRVTHHSGKNQPHHVMDRSILWLHLYPIKLHHVAFNILVSNFVMCDGFQMEMLLSNLGISEMVLDFYVICKFLLLNLDTPRTLWQRKWYISWCNKNQTHPMLTQLSSFFFLSFLVVANPDIVISLDTIIIGEIIHPYNFNVHRLLSCIMGVQFVGVKDAICHIFQSPQCNTCWALPWLWL